MTAKTKEVIYVHAEMDVGQLKYGRKIYGFLSAAYGLMPSNSSARDIEMYNKSEFDHRNK